MKTMKHTLKFAILLCIVLAGCNAHHENGNDGDSIEASTTLDNPFVHTAYFWFNEEATQEQKDAFIKDTEKLRNISTVKGLFYGAPANTDRPVVEEKLRLCRDCALRKPGRT